MPSHVHEMNVDEMKAYHDGAILGVLVLLGAAGALLAVETVFGNRKYLFFS